MYRYFSHIKVIAITIFLLILSIAFSALGQAPGPAKQSSHVSGVVIDIRTNKPLRGARVHFAHSLKGAITDKDGFFSIKDVPTGVHTIIISNLEHKIQKKTIVVNTSRDLQLDIALTSRINVDNRDKDQDQEPISLKNDWLTHLNMFTGEILETGANNDYINILNPYVLQFDGFKKGQYMEGKAEGLIKLENRVLGYVVNLYLEEFLIFEENKRIAYTPFFQELIPVSETEEKLWKEARKDVYEKFLDTDNEPGLGEMLPREYRPDSDSGDVSVKESAAIETEKAAITVLNYYDEFLKYEENGNWAEALNTLQEGYDLIEADGKVDPRIGRDYIELVTQQKIKELYQKATQLYFWGFSKAEAFDYTDVIKSEIEMMDVLLSREQYTEWEALFTAKDPELFSRIREFWARLDPIPSSIENERLIEHWNRIEYARQNFREANTTVYGTDDRGLVYVKYGQPERRVRETFGMYLDLMNDDRFTDFLLKLEIKTHKYNYNADFDLWIYKDLVNGDTVRFFFGREGGNGTFGMRYGVGEFIHQNAFFESGTLTNGQVLGPLLRDLYYEQLKDVDDFFYYRQLDIGMHRRSKGLFRSGGARSRMQIDMDRYAFTSYDKNDPAKRKAPKNSSEYDELVAPLNLKYFVTRVLDDNNVPNLGITTYAVPLTHDEDEIASLLYDLSDENDYDLYNTLIINDRSWFELGRLTDQPSERKTNVSTFYVTHLQNSTNYQVSAVASEIIPEVEIGETEPVTIYGQLAGHKTYITELEPLSTDESVLEVSDLVLGEEIPSGYENVAEPFPLLPNDRIKLGSNLQVYVEVYHLFLDNEDKAKFSIEYELKQKGMTGFVKRLFGRGKDKLISAQGQNRESLSRNSKELLAFDISNLATGDYEMTVKVTDLLSGQEKVRKRDLKIIN